MNGELEKCYDVESPQTWRCTGQKFMETKESVGSKNFSVLLWNSADRKKTTESFGYTDIADLG